MKNSKNNTLKYSLVALLALSACDYPAKPYPNPGTAENLIDVSKETMSFGLGGYAAVSRFSSMVQEDRPASAELKCSLKDTRCAQAKEILERNSVPVQVGAEGGNKIILTYERVITRDCDQRYVDNMHGSRSYNHPAFGCSVAYNTLQQVSDKHQFTNPAIMDLPDADKANQSYDGYLKPSTTRQVKDAKWSTE